jgi:hypothetical protein
MAMIAVAASKQEGFSRSDQAAAGGFHGDSAVAASKGAHQIERCECQTDVPWQ